MPKRRYEKPFLSFDQQIELIESRGLEVGNRAEAVSCLRRYGYYRLSGYWYIFRELDPLSTPESEKRRDQFKPGYSLADVLALYEFDKKLRLLVTDALERIEIAVRVELAYLLGMRSPFAHLEPEHLHASFSKPRGKKPNGRSGFDDWHDKYMSRYWQSSEQFVAHYAKEYFPPIPIWVAIEMWDFGMLNWLYSGLKYEDREAICHRFEVPNPKVMESWLRNLNHIRNIVAHHGRLWNRNIVDQSRQPESGTIDEFEHIMRSREIWERASSRVYVSLLIIMHVMRQIEPSSTWFSRIRVHLNDFPDIDGMTVLAMGFPQNWSTQPFWQRTDEEADSILGQATR